MINLPDEQFSSMNPQDAIGACTPLPQRLLLHRAVSTRADRAVRAKRRVCIDILIGMAPAGLIMVLARWIGVGLAGSCSAGAAILFAWTWWGYWRRNGDPMQLFEQEQWIDFEQRIWHSRRRFIGTACPSIDESVPLDALMLICARFLGEQRWTYEFGLCKAAEFNPDSELLPTWIDFIGAADTEGDAIALSTAIARCWGVACWLHSAAADENSRQLC